MNQLLIKIVGEINDGLLRPMSGISGLTYEFRWDAGVEAYVYGPKNQEETDDIFSVSGASFPNGYRFPWRFSAVWGTEAPQPLAPGAKPGATLSPVPSIAPFIKPTEYADYPANDLVDLARNLGFTPQGDLGVPDNILRQIDAYCVGRAWAIEESTRLQQQVAKLEAALIPIVPLPPVESAPQPPVHVRRKPGPKPGSRRVRVAA